VQWLGLGAVAFAILTGSGGCGGNVVGDGKSPDASVSAGGTTSPAGGTSATASGLSPLTPTEQVQVENDACANTGPLFNEPDNGVIACTYQYSNPQMPTCEPAPYGVNLMITTSGSQALLVHFLSTDCSDGDGFYQISSNLELVLCPKTCATLRNDVGASIQIFYQCAVSLIVC